MRVEPDLRPGKAACAIFKRVSGVGDDAAVPGVLLHPDLELVDQLLACRLRERDVTQVRRVERAAEDSLSSELDQLAFDLDLVARLRARGLERLGQLPCRRAGGRDAVAGVGTEDAVAPPARLRPVDEEVGETFGALPREAPPAPDVLEEAALELLDARAGGGGNRVHRDDRPSSTPSSGGSSSRSILFRTTICGSASRPAPYAASSRSIWAHRSPGRLRRVDHVYEHAGALEVREELVAEADAFARALDQPNVGHGQLPSVRRSTVPSTGSIVVNG